jgi:taurine transport system permease protein
VTTPVVSSTPEIQPLSDERVDDAPSSKRSPDSGPSAHWGSFRRAAGRGSVRLLAVAVFVFAWWVVTELKLWDELIVPKPISVWNAFIQSVTTHDGQRGLSGYFLWEHLWASLWRVLQGLFWGIVLGVPLGVLLAAWSPFRLLIEPYVNFIRSLPPLAYFTLLIFWFGIGDSAKTWLLFLAAFAPIAISTMAGVENVRRERVDAARSLGANRRQVILHTIFPSALPEVFTGVRLAVGFTWTTIVAAETVNGIPGIGGLAWATTKQLRVDVAVLCIIVIGFTAIGLDLVVRLVERFVVPWKGKA